MFEKDKHSVIIKELNRVKKEEIILNRKYERDGFKWKKSLENKIPGGVLNGLEKAFCKAFVMIFEKGTGIVEKISNKDEKIKKYETNALILKNSGSKKDYRRFRRGAKEMNVRSLAVTAVEGVGLGALGIGLPDIIIFSGILLKGIYGISLYYGFDYNEMKERMFILKIMEVAMARGENYYILNEEVENIIKKPGYAEITKDNIEEQIEKTANSFAVDMIVMKFLQGIPVAGIVGGAANPVYYNRVMKYAELKYRKRFLRNKLIEELEL